MSDPTELLEAARILDRLAEADESFGPRIPVRRTQLREIAGVLQRAYTAIESAPELDEIALVEIHLLRRLALHLYKVLQLDHGNVQSLVPDDLQTTGRYLWSEDEEFVRSQLPPEPVPDEASREPVDPDELEDLLQRHEADVPES